MPAIFYLAWVAQGEAFNAAAHATTATMPFDGTAGSGDPIFALEISHSEGEFPTLVVEERNPRVGLLSAGRNLWVWLSWDDGAGVEPLFNGRLIGIPQSLSDEVVRLQFVARPVDFITQKEALAATLRVLPYFDRVWLQERVDEPDTVLETQTARWHIGRTDLTVSASDIVTGEDGTITVDEDNHFYDDLEVTYGEAPLRRVRITGNVTWTQQGSGDVDLTRDIWQAFVDAGSPYAHPVVASLTGDGLAQEWPEPERTIGGGWIVGSSSTIEPATWVEGKSYAVTWVDFDEDSPTIYRQPTTELGAATAVEPWANWQAAFPMTASKINFIVHYDAARDRSETVTATIEADVQSLIVDPGAAEEDTIELSSDLVGEPIDPDAGSPGAFDRPIGDLRRNSYFKTTRGAQSFEYLLLLARARLIARARAVQVAFSTTWAIASGISCRHSARLIDYRLPDGEATGKVIAYTLSANGEDFRARITTACAIGYGVALGPPSAGTPTIAEAGILEAGIQVRSGAQTELLTGELQYQSFDDFEVTDDDGVNLFDMTARTVVNSITVINGPTAQKTAINASLIGPVPDPVGALRNVPTTVTLDLVPVEGGEFRVDFAPEVSELVIPQTINLEAA